MAKTEQLLMFFDKGRKFYDVCDALLKTPSFKFFLTLLCHVRPWDQLKKRKILIKGHEKTVPECFVTKHRKKIKIVQKRVIKESKIKLKMILLYGSSL